MLLKISMCLHC